MFLFHFRSRIFACHLVIGLLVLSLSRPACADGIDDWVSEQHDWGIQATYKPDPTLTVRLESWTGRPRIMEWIPVPDRQDLWMLRYYAGSPGTSVIVSIYRTVIVDMDRRRPLGDVAWRILPSDDPNAPQPRWHWSDRFLRVFSEDWGWESVQVAGPFFEDMAVPVESFPKATDIAIDPEEIPRIRQALEESKQQPVNFAGRYRIALWGCGSGCNAGAIVDKRTGAVWHLPFAAHRTFETVENVLTFRPDSRLLIVDGNLNERRDGTFLFAWEDGSLREIP